MNIMNIMNELDSFFLSVFFFRSEDATISWLLDATWLRVDLPPEHHLLLF